MQFGVEKKKERVKQRLMVVIIPKKVIKDLIQYVKDRNIDILPEMDIPGHSRAIIASYPEIAGAEGNIFVAPGWSKANNTICPSNEKSYAIMDAFFKEIA